MRLRHVHIERFRGINELRWSVGGQFACLVGAGDSTKTTILDAIELALSPRWNIQFHDSDFYNGVTNDPIRIAVTIGELPEEFISDTKYGLDTRAWSQNGELKDEPDDDRDENVITIQLLVGQALEPRWTIVNDRNPEGRLFGAADRESLGCRRLGEFLDRHFSWAKGSVLSRLTGEADGISNILADASRAARNAIVGVPPDRLRWLHDASEKALRVGAIFGVSGRTYRPHLDVEAVSVGVGGLSLHDGEVPLRRAGLATRRLLTVAMQYEAAKSDGLILIDEVEHGLEPHRLRRLLRTLRGTQGSEGRHVVMTTHSPIVLGELRAEDLRIVRSRNGVTDVRSVPENLQPTLRKASEAFLARRVIVCEGKTELGICRYLDQRWSEGGPSFALAGVALADGGGSQTGEIAKAFSGLGYQVAVLGDSDRPLTPPKEELERDGVSVYLWANNLALEQRMALDLPWEGVAAIVQQAIVADGEQSIKDSIAFRAEIPSDSLAGSPVEWASLNLNNQLRAAIGAAAKENGWFKRVDLAEEAAGVIVQHSAAIRDKDLGRKLEALKVWAHSNA